MTATTSGCRRRTASCMVLSKVTQRLRPALFARYMAVSASRSRPSAVAGYIEQARPMETVATTADSVSDSGVRKLSMMSAASVSPERDWPGVTYRATTNSSPPRRATMSEASTMLRSLSAAVRSTWSPVWCPQVSLIILNESRSRKSMSTRPPSRSERWR